MKGDATDRGVVDPERADDPARGAVQRERHRTSCTGSWTDKLVKTDITVGATTDTEVEVFEGLSKGDVVALSGPTSTRTA